MQTAPENRVFYPALDGLRAVAFLMVIGQHYLSLPWGWTGVNVFFVLSGFLITGILWDSRDQPHRARNFYVRRTLRIFPLYYLIVLLLVSTAPWLHWRWSPLWLAWPLYLGNFLRFTGPSAGQPGSALEVAADAQLSSPRFSSTLYFGHFWSLCLEEQFYLIWPWIVFSSISRKMLLRVCWFTVMLSPFVRMCVRHWAPFWMVNLEMTYRFTPLQLDSLLLGALLALLWRGEHRAKLLAVARWLAPLGIAAALIFIAITQRGASFGHYRYPAWSQTWGLTGVNVLAAMVMLCALQPAGVISRVLAFGPLRWMGRVSYGAYLFHDIFHDSYARFAGHLHVPLLHVPDNVMLTAVALAATLLMAAISFRFVESPFLNLKERLTLRQDEKPAP